MYSGQLVVIALLFLGALANVLLLSIGLGSSTPGREGFTLAHYHDVLTSPRLAGAALTSLKFAAITTVVAVPLALIAARLVLALESPRLRLVLGGLIIVPLLSSPVLRMLGYSILLSNGGPFGGLSLGSATAGAGLLYTIPGTVVGLVSNVLPVCALILFIQLLRIPAVEIMAARNLGADAWDIWWRIELPRCAGAVILSAQLCVIFVLGDLLAPSILGGNVEYTFAAALNDRMKIDDWSTAAAMAILLVVLACTTIALVLRLMRGPAVTVRRP